MTLTQAMSRQIKAVRKPFWNPTARLEMPVKVGDGFAPWCKLFDIGTEQPILFVHADDGEDDWEEVPTGGTRP